LTASQRIARNNSTTDATGESPVSLHDTSAYYTAGNVGIGTSTPDPGFLLDVAGTAQVEGSLFRVGSSNFVVASNKVGIGTLAPNAKLDVNGNVAVAGSEVID